MIDQVVPAAAHDGQLSAADSKKRARSLSGIEAAADTAVALTRADMDHLVALAKEARQVNPESAAAADLDSLSSQGNRNEVTARADHKHKPAAGIMQKQEPAAALDAHVVSTKHRQDKPSNKDSRLAGTKSIKDNSLQEGQSTSERAVNDTAAAAGNSSEGTAGKAKPKKLGRNARLRLKRQAYRQQQAVNADPCESATDTALPTLANSTQRQAAGKDHAARKKPKLSADASSASAGPAVNTGSKSAAPDAPPKVKQKSTSPAASLPKGAKAPAATTAGKQKKKGLLEQMRSKLSGGRFRMLNEQLYMSQGHEAFQMMQAQPDLYQQYHEVSCSALLYFDAPLSPHVIQMLWLIAK